MLGGESQPGQVSDPRDSSDSKDTAFSAHSSLNTGALLLSDVFHVLNYRCLGGYKIFRTEREFCRVKHY